MEQLLSCILQRIVAGRMERLRDIPDDSDVAEFDQVVLKGSEIKRLLPGASELAMYKINRLATFPN
jgi:hypothetical protein